MSGSSSSNKQDNSSSTTAPGFAPQASALTTAFNAAPAAYEASKQAVAPTDFTAQFSPDQLATFQRMLGYANNSNAPAQNAAAGTAMTNAGVSATQGALSDLGRFNPANATDQNIADANKYADNQNIAPMVQAAMRDANQQAQDITLPGMQADAAASGNINSTRVGGPDGGIASGIIQRGLAQKAGDISANLRGQAYDAGLDRAQQGSQANQAARLTAMQAALSGGTAATNTGVDATSGSVNDATNLFNIANTGAAGETAAAQAKLDNQKQQYDSAVSSPYDSLNQLMALIGQNNWGTNSTGTSNSTTTNTPSAYQIIGGLMSATGQMAGGFTGKK